MSYQIQVPRINAAVITPNPVDFNTQFLISVTASEETVTLEPQYFYSGELYAGEV